MTLMNKTPEPGDPRVLRYLDVEGHTFMLWDACHREGSKYILGYTIWNEQNKLMESGEFGASPKAEKKPDSNEVIEQLLGFFYEEIPTFTDKEPHQNWFQEGERYLADSEENFIGGLLHHWHVGMDAIYGVGSYLVHNRDTKPMKPPKEQVERAIALLEKNKRSEEGQISLSEGSKAAHEKNIRELSFLLDVLNKMLQTEGATT